MKNKDKKKNTLTVINSPFWDIKSQLDNGNIITVTRTIKLFKLGNHYVETINEGNYRAYHDDTTLRYALNYLDILD